MTEKEYETLRGLVKVILTYENEITEETIRDSIKNSLGVLSRRNPQLSCDPLEEARLISEMESFYNIKISSRDAAIYGTLKKKPTWWTDIKNKRNNYYWSSYEEYLNQKENLPKSVRDRIGERADTVMNYLFDPLNDSGSEKKYGMVIGSVQSGKTANYTALVCKAADAGFKIIIVIAGSTSILRQQTQIRIDKSFVGRFDLKSDDKKADAVYQTAGTVYDHRPHDEEEIKKLRPLTMTTEKVDGGFNKAYKNALTPVNGHNTTAPLIFVVLKTKSDLESVVKWAKDQDPSFPLLLIDDEADNASVNTQKDYKKKMTAINKGIRQILKRFPKSAYVGFTATPFANVFIDPLFEKSDDEKDLFPKDFIISLSSPDNYFGPGKVFGESGESEYVIPLPDVDSDTAKTDWEKVFPVRQKRDSSCHKVSELPQSLKEAIALYLFNISIRNRRGFEKKHNTMLIHVSRLIDMHEAIAKRVKEYLKQLSDDVRMCYRLPYSAEYAQIIKPLERIFDENRRKKWNSDTSICTVDFHDVLDDLLDIIDSIEIGTANTYTNGIRYATDHQTNMIAIGGNALARGFTLPNLSVSYFIRNTSMCDTLLQMGRWFGYRDGYSDLCRVFMPSTYAENFSEAYKASRDLEKCVEKLEESNKTPEDFLIAISQHPATRMMLTAKSKMRNAAQDKGVYLDGTILERGTVNKDDVDNSNYIRTVDSFITNLGEPDKSFSAKEKGYRWMGVSAKKIADLIKSCPKAFNSKLDPDLICEYVLENSEHLWRVVVPSLKLYKDNKEKDHGWTNKNKSIYIQKMRRNDKQRDSNEKTYSFSVSDYQSERMGLTESEIHGMKEETRPECRKVRKEPLLIISIADLYNSDDKNATVIENGESFPFFSLSFAGEFNSPVFKPLMNCVYNQAVSDKLLEEKAEEEESDDYQDDEGVMND